VALVRGAGVVGDELNRTFPDVETTKVEDFVRRWWDGVQLEEARWEGDRSFM
jgi:hypothetical protein